jgi:hypothetical protein
LLYRWWQYVEVDSYDRSVEILNAKKQKSSVVVPANAKNGNTIHIVCKVINNGTPQPTRYQRVVITIK